MLNKLLSNYSMIYYFINFFQIKKKIIGNIAYQKYSKNEYATVNTSKKPVKSPFSIMYLFSKGK